MSAEWSHAEHESVLEQEHESTHEPTHGPKLTPKRGRARVVLVMAPVRVSRDFIDYPYFADRGVVQAGAALREAGFEVAIVDALATAGATLTPLGTGEGARDVLLGPPLASFERALTDALAARVDAVVVALSPFHRPPARDPFLGGTLALARSLAKGAPLVLADLYQSGEHVVDAPPEQVLASYPEACTLLRHEAELSLAPLVRALLEGERPRVVEGEEARSLDELPLPAWDLVDLAAKRRFHEEVVRALGRPRWAFPLTPGSLPLVTSRGCPYRCVHCSSNPAARVDGALVRPKTQRRMSPERLRAALAQLVALGVDRVHVLDELVNVSARHFEAVLDAIEEHDLAFEVPNGMRADYVERAHVERMKGRVTTLSVSAESGSPRVLREIVRKDLDLKHIERVAELAHDVGVPLLVHFMIGLPGETKREINETLELAARLHDRWGVEPAVQFATPLPGTPLARLARESGRSLPVVDDFGPLFQTRPSLAGDLVSVAELSRFKWTFDARLEASRGPKKVILNVTYRCNNRCTFCATGTRTQLDGDFDKQRELLVKYRKLGVRMLDLDGGEPTLAPHLLPLIRFARQLGYDRVNVTTNGRLASYPDFAEKLVRSGATSILVSLHGPDAQTHAQNVGVAEAFEQSTRGVSNLVRLGAEVPGLELGANVTVTKSNAKKLRELALMVRELGLRWLNVQFLTPFGRATKWVAPDTQAAADDVMRLIDELGADMKIQVINLPFCFMPGYEAHMMGDLLKLERHMLFVNNDEVNLFEYLRERRVKREPCHECPSAVFCGGFYELDDVPEPTWLVRPEDLVRPVREGIPRVGE